MKADIINGPCTGFSSIHEKYAISGITGL